MLNRILKRIAAYLQDDNKINGNISVGESQDTINDILDPNSLLFKLMSFSCMDEIFTYLKKGIKYDFDKLALYGMTYQKNKKIITIEFIFILPK